MAERPPMFRLANVDSDDEMPPADETTEDEDAGEIITDDGNAGKSWQDIEKENSEVLANRPFLYERVGSPSTARAAGMLGTMAIGRITSAGRRRIGSSSTKSYAHRFLQQL